MVSALDTPRLSHRKVQPRVNAGETNDAPIANPPDNKPGTTRPWPSPQSNRIASSRSTLISPGSSLRSRLPWLDGKPPTEAPTVVSSPLNGPRRQSSINTSSPSSSSPEFPRRHMISPIRKKPSSLVQPVVTTAPLRRVNTRPKLRKSHSIVDRPSEDPLRRKSPTAIIRLPMKPSVDQTSRELRPKKEKTTIEPPIMQKMSLIDSLHPFRDPPSPLIPPYRSTTLPPLPQQTLDDPITYPLNQAINRMEDLMRQAEDLVNEAAHSGRPEEAPGVIGDATKALRRAGQATIHRRSSPTSIYPRQRSFASSRTSPLGSRSSSLPSIGPAMRAIAIDGPTSPPSLHGPYKEHGEPLESEAGSLAGDESDTSPSRGRRGRCSDSPPLLSRAQKPAVTSPVTRDFADSQQPQQEDIDQSSSREQWIGRRPSRKMPKVVNIPAEPAQHNRTPYTAYISDSPSPRDNTLRHRKSTLPKESPPAPCSPRRHNTASNLGQEDYRPQARAISPIPWKEKLEQKSMRNSRQSFLGNFTSQDYKKDKDPEKYAGRSKSKHKHHFGGWRLGHQKREPVARKWGTVKKRVSATIACINTALVGYILGLYVTTFQNF
jgi:hypothetical protein